MADSKTVAGFASTHGRPPSVLLVGNVANNAYLIAYYLRSVGWDADVLCADYYHSMGCPEWEHATFDASTIDEFAPDWSGVHAQGFSRPDWFSQGPSDTAMRYLIARRTDRDSAAELWGLLSDRAPTAAQQYRVGPDEGRVRSMLRQTRRLRKVPRRIVLLAQLATWRLQETVFGKSSRPMAWDRKVSRLRELMALYDVVEACGSEVAWAGLTGIPFVAFEHGTIRWASQREDVIQSLTLEGFKRSRAVFVTNGDSFPLAEGLGLTELTGTIHPLVNVDPALEKQSIYLADSVLAAASVSAGPMLLCPLRHDWRIKGTDLYLRALPDLRARIGDDFTLVLTQWGAEVNRSKALIRELGVEGVVRWIPPQGRQVLLQLMRSSLVVLDQTTLPHFGSTAPQALMLGVPVMSSYHPVSTLRICAEPAPILPVFRPADVGEWVVRLLDPAFRSQQAAAAIDWSRRFHSDARVIADQETVLAGTIGQPAARSGHHSAAAS